MVRVFCTLSLAAALFLGGLWATGAAQAEEITMVTVPTPNHTLIVPGTDVQYVTSNGVPRNVYMADKTRAHKKQPVAVYLNNSLVLKSYQNGH